MTMLRTRIAWLVAWLAGAAVAASACGTGRVTMPGAIPQAGGPAGPPLRVRVAGSVVVVPLERYVLGAALSEVTPVGEAPRTVERIYEVQAVIARTYALSHQRRHATEGFDLCDDTHCQLYQPDRIRTSSFARAAEAAVAQTRGVVLRTGGRDPAIIDALFHADCGGHTTTPAAAWGGTNHGYLRAVDDQVPGLTHMTWSFEASRADWRAVLDRDARTAIGGDLTLMEAAATGPGDRVTRLRLVGARDLTVSGDVFRAVVTAARGPRAVMSTRFTVQATPNGFRLVGTGFGHGVGLCQRGAAARAARGDSLAAILAHYYPGTEMGRWGDGEMGDW